MLSYIIVSIIGFFGGVIIAIQIFISIHLLALIKHGYYMADDIFHGSILSLIIGIPIGGIIGAGLSIFLFQRGVKLPNLATIFSIGIVLSFSSSNYFDKKIRPPLVKAAQLNDLAYIQKAIRNNTNLNVKDMNGRTALIESVFWEYPDITKCLIQAGADLNVKEKDGGATALILAIDSSSSDIIELLIKAGADVNAKTDSGWTPLMFAVSSGKLNTVKILIEAGADVHAKTNSGQTPLTLATQASYVDIVRLLRQAGAKNR